VRTELHFHLLPGVDDGPKTLDESLELARMALADGSDTVVELAQDDIARLASRELEIAAHGPAGRRWVLLEAPLSLDVAGLWEAAGELSARGYGLLIGHPERCDELMRLDGALDELLGAGARLQVNGSSLLGRHGEQARSWGLQLVREGRVSVIASDAHRPTRGPVLGEAVAALVADGVAPEAAEGMVATTPRALLEGGLPAATLGLRPSPRR
jgi:protein-tyrosine phosphatase